MDAYCHKIINFNWMKWKERLLALRGNKKREKERKKVKCFYVYKVESYIGLIDIVCDDTVPCLRLFCFWYNMMWCIFYLLRFVCDVFYARVLKGFIGFWDKFMALQIQFLLWFTYQNLYCRSRLEFMAYFTRFLLLQNDELDRSKNIMVAATSCSKVCNLGINLTMVV